MSKRITCIECGEEFEDINYEAKFKNAKRTMCNKCVDKVWKKVKKNNKDKDEVSSIF